MKIPKIVLGLQIKWKFLRDLENKLMVVIWIGDDWLL